jgi:hypothetical protein
MHIFVADIERVLLLNRETLCPKPMHQGVFVDLLHVPMTMITMDGKVGFSYLVA